VFEVRPKIVFLYSLIASVAMSALIAIGVLVFGEFGDIEVRVLFTTLTVTVTSILGLACGASLEASRGRLLPLAGIALSIVSALMCFLIIWNVLDDSEVFVKSFLTATLIAASCSHLSLLSLARLDARFRWSRVAAHVCVWLLAAILLYLMWFEPEGSGDLVFRVIGVLSILIATITVVTPVFHKLSADDDSIARIDSEIDRLRAKITELETRKANLRANTEFAETAEN
jgi:hypothetical protein